MARLFPAILFCILVLAVQPVLAEDFSGYWVGSKFTIDGQDTAERDGLPVRLLTQYQLFPDGRVEAIVYGAWGQGTWRPEGDSVRLEIVCGEEFVPEVLSFRDGQLVYTDAESAEVWLTRADGRMDADKVLDDLQNLLTGK